MGKWVVYLLLASVWESALLSAIKYHAKRKKELINVLLFSSRSRITGTTALTSLSIKFWVLSASFTKPVRGSGNPLVF